MVIYVMDSRAVILVCLSLMHLLQSNGKEMLMDPKGNKCEYKIHSESSLNGTITSPMYPAVYPKSSVCIYEFIGKSIEKIQITFIDFLLPSDDKHCYYADTVEIFFVKNHRYQSVDILCGNVLPNFIMSPTNKLLIEFRGMYSGISFRGFKLQYSFLTNFGVKTGKQYSNNTCSFEYHSIDTINGTFQSPNFPGTYLSNIRCDYYFYGLENQTIEIKFTYFDIEGKYPCEAAETASDSVEFSNYMTRDRKFPFHCGKISDDFIVKSDGKFFRVTFRSNDKMDGTGFIASYYFKTLPSHTERNLTTQVPMANNSEKHYSLSHLLISVLTISTYFISLTRLK